MSKEQREAMRAHLARQPHDDGADYAGQVLTLLDALDEMERERDGWKERSDREYANCMKEIDALTERAKRLQLLLDDSDTEKWRKEARRLKGIIWSAYCELQDEV